MKERNIVTQIILTVVTCGLYGLYWSYMVAKEIVTFKDPADNGLLEILLMIFLAPVGAFLTEKKFTEGCAAKGIEHKDNTILYLILSLLGLHVVTLALMQNDMNKLAAE